jgi:hypothetical protein
MYYYCCVMCNIIMCVNAITREYEKYGGNDFCLGGWGQAPVEKAVTQDLDLEGWAAIAKDQPQVREEPLRKGCLRVAKEQLEVKCGCKLTALSSAWAGSLDCCVASSALTDQSPVFYLHINSNHYPRFSFDYLMNQHFMTLPSWFFFF